MKNLYYLILSAILLLFVVTLSAQHKDFKDVAAAQDVIDNYLISVGGRENLEKIKSVRMNGKVDAMGMVIPVTTFISKKYFYMNVEDSAFGMTIAYNNKSKKGWTKMFGKVEDMKAEDAAKYHETLENALWEYYLNKDKHGVSYELMQNDKVGDQNAYVVDFKKGDRVLYTVYFDTANYYRIKHEKEGRISIYEDFREVGTSGVKMPYVITQQGTVKVDKYEFNTKLDKNLLKKPEEKEE